MRENELINHTVGNSFLLAELVEALETEMSFGLSDENLLIMLAENEEIKRPPPNPTTTISTLFLSLTTPVS